MTGYPQHLGSFIDGQRLSGTGRERLPVLNPATGAVLAELSLATTADLDHALDASARAFKSWRLVASWTRAAILYKAAALLRERREHIARVMTLEEGKTLREARGEVDVSAEIFEWSAEEGKRLYGRLVPPRQPGQRQLVLKEPLGPVAAFSPWNFPAITPARKIAAALASGCTIILKPAEETPGTALEIVHALHDAGLPPGVLNVVFGHPSEVSAHLLRSPVTRKLSFTGSTIVGRELAVLAAQGLKRSTLELGGHAPVLVFEDAAIEKVVDQTLIWKFRNAGQVCTSPTRFYIQQGIYDRFVSRLTDAVRAMSVGNGMDEANLMGPLANERRLAAVETLCADAVQRGARIEVGGTRVGDAGLFWSPTVVRDVPDDAAMMSEEPFGPIAMCNAFRDRSEAIAMANRLPYGLAAYAFTRSASTIMALGDEIECGMIGVNNYAVTAPETPFGGHKDSGYGSESGIEGLEGYLQTKFISENAA